jgi:hypothetical protein
MSDIVERLRHCSENCGDEYLHELAGRAAAEIEQNRIDLNEYQLDVERLRAALVEIEQVALSYVHMKYAKLAREALAEEKPNG